MVVCLVHPIVNHTCFYHWGLCTVGDESSANNRILHLNQDYSGNILWREKARIQGFDPQPFEESKMCFDIVVITISDICAS